MTVTIGRRELLVALGGAAAAWPLTAHAQKPVLPVVGFIDSTLPADSLYREVSLRDGLKEAGFIDGHKIALELRFAGNKLDQLPTLAADLLQRQPAVIVCTGTTMPAVMATNSTIPIVFVSGADPVAGGLVSNLNRPGGNITGVSFASAPLQPKRLELLHELVPRPTTIAWLRNPATPTFEFEVRDVEAAAQALGRQLLTLNAESLREIDAAFASMAQSRVGGLLIGSGILFVVRRRQLALLAARHGVAAISATREFVMAGGLMSYGASDTDAYRRAGERYVGPILKGAKPGDLPVEMPTKYELVINLVTASVLGLEIPPKLLALADEVIE